MNTPLRVLDLCAGIGGISLACVYAGMEIVGQVEINPFCKKVLQKNFPDVKRMSDMKEVHDDEFGAIDVVVGGIPCQPFSGAGKRRGIEDDRHLWPYAFAIITVAQPTWIVIENVHNFVGMALDLVQTDLASAGYETQAFVLPACAIGATHERKRLFLVAYSHRKRDIGTPRTITGGQRGTSESTGLCRWEDMANTGSAGPSSIGDGLSTWADHPTSPSGTKSMENSASARREEQPDTARLYDGPQPSSTSPDMAYTSSQRCEECNAPTSESGTGIGNWRVETRQLPRFSQSRMGRDADGFPYRMDGYHFPSGPSEPQHANEPPRTVTGRQPYRNQRIEAIGNAVVPQQVYPLLKMIADIEYGYGDCGTREHE